MDEVTFSDHALIRYSLNLSLSKASKVRNLTKADWFKFHSLTEAKTDEPLIISNAWIDKECESITNLINTSFNSAAPLITIKPKVKTQAFWSKELSMLRTNLRTLYRRYKQTQNTPDWETYITTVMVNDEECHFLENH